jgi:P27 family predicted phage terminase small subunit
MPTESDPNRPAAPPEIEGEAAVEWDRVCSELSAAGRLDKADRAILVIYCQTWAVYTDAMRSVMAWGAIVEHANKVGGASPFYKVAKETAQQLQKLLNDMGMTQAARHKIKAVADVPAEIEF